MLMICAYGKLLADIKHLEIHYMLLPTNIQILQNLLKQQLRVLYGKSVSQVPLNLWSILKWLILEIVTWKILLDIMPVGLMITK